MAPTAHLRVLATTDLHMQLTGYDYVTDRPTARPGLAGIASLIDAARAEAAAQHRVCILLDNGDLLEGSPLAGQLAQMPVAATHPAIACINQLRYDAVGLGNHDLDFGLPYLDAVIGHLKMPVLASNLHNANLPAIKKTALIDCALPTSSEGPTTLRIGLVSVMPTLTAIWNKHRLGGKTRITNAADCLRKAIPALRDQGAELVVVLAHMGIAAPDHSSGESALELAKVPGVDALIAGHTHQRFPGYGHKSVAGVAPQTGTLMQVPTIMPGHGGSDLGVLDLTLRQGSSGKWSVIGHVSSLRQNTAQTPRHPNVLAAVAPAHAIVRKHLTQPVGRITTELNNYFALAAPSGIGALCAQAAELTVRAAMRECPSDLPLLVAATAHTTGGRDGPDNYLTIPKGEVQRRHLAGLNPHNNQIWVIEVTGAALRRRAEHAAGVFDLLSKGTPPANLLKTEVPGFNFEALYGLTYQIDPTKPEGSRIEGLRHEGRLVGADDRFLLATDQFRAAGGAGFERTANHDIYLRLPCTSESAVVEALHKPAQPRPVPWTFAPCGGVTALLPTAPQAADHLDAIAHLSPRTLGLDASGFLRVALTL